MRNLFMTMMLALSVAAVSAKDIKTLVVTTNPVMHCNSCEEKIKNNIRFEKGIKNIETNVEEQKVTITYDADKNSAENIKKAFRKIGYEVSDYSAKEEKCAEMKECSNCEEKGEIKACCKKAEGMKKDCCKEMQQGTCEKAEGMKKNCCKEMQQGTCEKAEVK